MVSEKFIGQVCVYEAPNSYFLVLPTGALFAGFFRLIPIKSGFLIAIWVALGFAILAYTTIFDPRLILGIIIAMLLQNLFLILTGSNFLEVQTLLSNAVMHNLYLPAKVDINTNGKRKRIW